MTQFITVNKDRRKSAAQPQTADMKKEMNKQFNHADYEKKIYQYWLDRECFTAHIDKSKKPFTIVIPPPNITGQLHMGHALNNTLQDCLIRRKRMQGTPTLWVPGSDHASIATEAKIVAALKEEGTTKEELGREGFLKRAWEWKDKYEGRILEQLKELGCSCDWTRLRFTLDEGCSRAVNEVFEKYYNEGIIYRGERIINWCPSCKTSISDAEVEYEEKHGHFWHLRYKLADSDEYLELATTRPETMLGDTAVAVNPDDERYAKYVGRKVILPIVNREIPVVADSYVDMEFGTGVVKITPAHDPNDFEVGLRHGLEIVNIFTDDAKIVDGYGEYSGLDRYEARKKIVKELEETGVLVRVEDHTHNVGSCYRCGSVVEPKVSKQWFVKMDELAKPAIEAVKDGRTKFIPERFEKNYFHWLDMIHDWCISRQLWWGHRIPAWYCGDCGEITVSKHPAEKCAHCGSSNIHQDEDTLDTWFSSALWPFSTLGWPDKTEDLEYFYPTNVLVTGYDIIFFWVVRMMFSGLRHMGEVPFDTVLIHGLVRDDQGRKMSKSLGNGIDPLQIVEEYGADALRFVLVNGNAPGNDSRFSYDKVLAARNFANKIWNAARYVYMNLPEDFEFKGLPSDLKTEDKWLLNKLNRLVGEVNENMEKCDIGIASQKMYDFFWRTYCDWYVEISKPRIAAADGDVLQILIYVLETFIKLIHPIMPFITEEIWQNFRGDGKPLMMEKYPEFDASIKYDETEKAFERVLSAVVAVRNMRNERKIKNNVKTRIFIETEDAGIFNQSFYVFDRLASEVICDTSFKPFDSKTVTLVSDGARIFIPLNELIDAEQEKKRLETEIAKVEKEIGFLDKKLGNKNFVERAPENVVNAEREKLADYNAKREMLLKSLSEL